MNFWRALEDVGLVLINCQAYSTNIRLSNKNLTACRQRRQNCFCEEILK